MPHGNAPNTSSARASVKNLFEEFRTSSAEITAASPVRWEEVPEETLCQRATCGVCILAKVYVIPMGNVFPAVKQAAAIELLLTTHAQKLDVATASMVVSATCLHGERRASSSTLLRDRTPATSALCAPTRARNHYTFSERIHSRVLCYLCEAGPCHPQHNAHYMSVIWQHTHAMYAAQNHQVVCTTPVSRHNAPV